MARRKRRKVSRRRRPRAKVRSNSFFPLVWVKDFFVKILSFVHQGFHNLPGRVKRYLVASFVFLFALISFLSFFNLAGRGGESLERFFFVLLGHAVFLLPLVLVGLGLVFLFIPRKWFFAGFFALVVFLLGIAGLLEILDISYLVGGEIGRLLGQPLTRFFGELVSFFVFLGFTIVGLISYWYVLGLQRVEKKEEKGGFVQGFKRFLDSSRFKVIKVEPEKREEEEEPVEEKTEEVVPTIAHPKLRVPPLNLLEHERERAKPGNIKENTVLIKNTLSNFGIEVAMAEVNVGPTVTQYTLKPAEGVKLSRITGLSNNLALALAAHPIRIEAPIPGRSLVGVEVPNKVRSKVRLKDLIGHPEFKRTSNLGFVLGRDVSGNPQFADLGRLPHLLVAGATGTGKTIFLNSLILSLLYRNGPKSLKIILIDPKRVEFSAYKGLPHLLAPVIFGAQESINALTWLVEEMEKRFGLLSELGSRNIGLFNEKALAQKEKPLPYIILIIDELADLMAARGKEMEVRVVRIAQMARAVGIHLVLATQRPSTEVITGLIKANITSRVSFQVPTQIDSRTVLDMSGAEKLLGLGDMLYVSAETVKPRRIQGAFVSEKEVKRVVDWIIENVGSRELLKNDISTKFEDYLKASGPEGREEHQDMAYDPLLEKAKEVVIRSGKASASLLQRRLRIGYVRAARLLDMLEAEGVIGPSEGAKARKVYFKQEDEEEVFE
jgi:S-DNA-T family DNA segregation ATPase FtsK/SpoIIIE